MEYPKEIRFIDDKITELKDQKRNLQKKLRMIQLNTDRKLRLKSNNNGKSNCLTRVSNNFSKKLDLINDKREENGLDRLSNPKITELIIKHNSCWKPIQEDIIFFNTNLNEDNEGEKQ